MLIKAGVDISRLKRKVRKSLNIVEAVMEMHKEELIITSTYEGNHTPGTDHYVNEAYDIRLPKKAASVVFNDIKKRLGEDFLCLKEFDHIHISWIRGE